MTPNEINALATIFDLQPTGDTPHRELGWRVTVPLADPVTVFARTPSGALEAGNGILKEYRRHRQPTLKEGHSRFKQKIIRATKGKSWCRPPKPRHPWLEPILPNCNGKAKK